MIIDQFVLELITMVLCIRVCFGCVVDNLRVYVYLDKHIQWLELQVPLFTAGSSEPRDDTSNLLCNSFGWRPCCIELSGLLDSTSMVTWYPVLKSTIRWLRIEVTRCCQSITGHMALSGSGMISSSEYLLLGHLWQIECDNALVVLIVA